MSYRIKLPQSAVTRLSSATYHHNHNLYGLCLSGTCLTPPQSSAQTAFAVSPCRTWKPGRARELEHTGRWVVVASVCDMPPGTVIRISGEGEDIAVFNADGRFYAIGDVCTHAQQSLAEGEFYDDIHGWVVECPLHGALFDLATGAAISLPATGNAGLFDTRVKDGVVYVNPDPVVPFHT